MPTAANAPAQILAWIEAGAPDPSRFEELALDLFAWQWERNPAYRNYGAALGATPDTVDSWQRIPALPCDAFKLAEIPVRCFPAEEIQRVFLTSGTTGGPRGRHEFASTAAYEASLRSGWRGLGLPELANPWFLTPAPEAAPESSLVHMFATLGENHPDLNQRWLLREGTIMTGPLRQAAREGTPVAVLGTALAFLEAMESAPEPIPLPPGSWLMETGGYKGSRRQLEKREFYRQLETFFGVAANRIHNEYGMTEISSPFYTSGLNQPHRGSLWTGIRVIDPETGEVADEGAAGYLEIVDLANIGSAMAIRTQDFAVRKGDREFMLLGRDPGALPRGCSRGAEALLGGATR